MSEEVIISREGRAGRLRLNRPRALNALTPGMVADIRRAIEAWRHDPGLDIVLIEGAGEKAFCAGGDIREVYEAGRAGDFEFGRRFWSEEYRLNAALAAYPKPVVSLMHGYVMGGGVGIGCHVSHRVADPDVRLAMPECAIGLIPDVGGTLLLAHAPGHIGEYMALTGARLKGTEARYAGFADYVMSQSDWPSLIDALVRDGDPALLSAVSQPSSPWPRDRSDTIRKVFGQQDIPAITAAAAGTEFEAGLRKASPLSLFAKLELVRRARAFDRIEPALRQEFCFTARAAEQADLLEGIRAVLIDRDNAPDWRYPTIGDVPPGLIDDLLRPIDEADALFPDPMPEREVST